MNFIRDILEDFKNFIKKYEADIVLSVGVALISLISFSAGWLSAPKLVKQPIRIDHLSASAFKSNTPGDPLQAQDDRVEGEFVASKNSTKYHLPDCTGARRISEHNKIWFSSREEAESLGYTPAANCPGL